MRIPTIPAIIAFFFFLLAGIASAQRTQGTVPPRPNIPTTDPFGDGTATPGSRTAEIIVEVVDESGTPLRDQALVKLYGDNSNTTTWGTTQKRSEVEFDAVLPGDYEIEASAAGYETTTQTLKVVSSHEVANVLVRLKVGSTDKASAAKPGQLLAPKAGREAEKGIAALKAGNLNEVQKHFDAAYKLAPTNADVNYLLGLLYLQKKDAAQAKSYFTKAASFDPQHVRSLSALGQLLLTEGDYKAAAVPLEQAVSVDGGRWQAHSMLANVYLHERDFEKAKREAELAIKSGKGAGGDAELTLGQALAGLGKISEAIQTLQNYLVSEPSSQAAPAVRDAIARLQSPSRTSAEEHPSPVGFNNANPASVTSLPGTTEADLPLPTWGPPNVDDAKPVIALGAACPADFVIDEAGKRVKELVENLARFDATEDVLHETLDELGKPVTKETRKFDYQVSISEPQQGQLKVDEYRNGLTDHGDFPAHIATKGLPSLAFDFHPDMRDSFDLVCEGLGSWDGQATWLVHFRQRSDKPSRLQSFQFDDGTVRVDLKGRAWIAASTYQIIRLEADLVNSERRIQLLTEHQIVEYGPVEFKNRNMQLWLPTRADLYMDFRHQRFHRRHSFGHYMLFSVGSTQKISQPKIPDPPAQTPDH
jgi:tetratricopeptide (TPR) repeat protein